MFARVSALATLALPLLAAAAAVEQRTDNPPTCSTGPVQCCNSVQKADSKDVSSLLGLLGLSIPANILVGLTCNPISVIGIGGNNCNAQTVCCENNNFNGLVAIGCTPINIGL